MPLMRLEIREYVDQWTFYVHNALLTNSMHVVFALSASDCFELGRIAYNTEDYYHTVLWMDETMMKIVLERNETVDRSEILDYLSFSLFKVCRLVSGLDMWSRFWFCLFFEEEYRPLSVITLFSYF